MTTEEKAKAYDMALEGARKELGVDRKELEVVQRVLHNIFPELTESEDERIMDTIIEHFKGFSPIKVFGDFDFTSKQILAYLEKQKEQKPLTTEEWEMNSVAFLTEMGYTCIPPSKDGVIEKKIDALMKEQKPVNDSASTMIPSCWECEQKEQKPMVSYSVNLTELIAGGYEEFRSILKDKGLDYEPEPAYWESTTQLIVAYVKQYLKEQKPVEWSEEDEKMRINILNALTPQLVYSSGKGTCTGTSMYKYDNEINWLKSLRPQPKQEWTEEDEEKLRRLCWIVLNISVKGLITEEEETELCKWMDKWLNHNPVSRWKPSEEQMSMLLSVIRDPNNAGAESCHLALESLYNDLKKL